MRLGVKVNPLEVRRALVAGTMIVLALSFVPEARAQRGGRGAAPPAPTGPLIDLTGYWVSLITDDWRYRMLTPPKGNVDFLPINAEGRRVAETWDPARDEAAGEQCRGYGAVGVMRLPGRLHITWENDTTLRLDTDTGTQTRRFHVGGSQAPSGGEPTWQGYSAAQWERPGGALGRGQQGVGQLKVVTKGMRPGYLRKNGIPYSQNAVLTEYFVRLTDGTDGTEYLAVTAFLEDPQYLFQPYIRTVQFKKLPNQAGWNPTPCSAR
jgi:hypothetical protein